MNIKGPTSNIKYPFGNKELIPSNIFREFRDIFSLLETFQIVLKIVVIIPVYFLQTGSTIFKTIEGSLRFSYLLNLTNHVWVYGRRYIKLYQAAL